jgi:hypothetical protein
VKFGIKDESKFQVPSSKFQVPMSSDNSRKTLLDISSLEDIICTKKNHQRVASKHCDYKKIDTLDNASKRSRDISSPENVLISPQTIQPMESINIPHILKFTPSPITTRPKRMVRVSPRTIAQTSWTITLPILSCSFSMYQVTRYLSQAIPSSDLIDVCIKYISAINQIQYVARVSNVSAMEKVEKLFGIIRDP